MGDGAEGKPQPSQSLQKAGTLGGAGGRRVRSCWWIKAQLHLSGRVVGGWAGGHGGWEGCGQILGHPGDCCDPPGSQHCVAIEN